MEEKVCKVMLTCSRRKYVPERRGVELLSRPSFCVEVVSVTTSYALILLLFAVNFVQQGFFIPA